MKALFMVDMFLVGGPKIENNKAELILIFQGNSSDISQPMIELSKAVCSFGDAINAPIVKRS